MRPEEAGVVLDMLVAAFPMRVMSEETVQLYAIFLADVDLDTGIEAVARWIARETKFPAIAELRAWCEVVRGKGPPDADQAYAEVLRAVSRWGSRATPQWSHPAVSEAVDAIGWRDICMSDNPPALRAHFERAYVAAKKRTTDPGHRRLVDGIKGNALALVGAARKELKP